MSEYVNQYVNSIINGVNVAAASFRARRYAEAAHDLIPILDMAAGVVDEEKAAAIDKIIKDIEGIEEKAAAGLDGSTKEARAYSFDKGKNRIAYSVYRRGVRAAMGAIKQDLLLSRYNAAAENINKLNFDEVPPAVDLE